MGLLDHMVAIFPYFLRKLRATSPLEKGTVTHSGILAWRIPWTEEPGGLQSTGCQRLGLTDFHFTSAGLCSC